ncbi:hypothetical protein QBZ16_002126 [Prototheca wickerhamii]|uniref:Uncharacterized protein n=1 Tax=Prototheca wickerhamii TaxID=3111 RepID=A0AAD9IJS8_PROWI|nr:hypothetical protein QBZ16_002126 [Prototheca wickerhamii]
MDLDSATESQSRMEAMRRLLHAREQELERLRARLNSLLDDGGAAPRTVRSAPGTEDIRLRLEALQASHAAQSAALQETQSRASRAEETVAELRARLAETEARLQEGETWTEAAHARARDAIIADLTAKLEAAEAGSVPKQEHAAVREELEASQRANTALQRLAEGLEARVSAAEARAAALQRGAEDRKDTRARLAEAQARLGEEERRGARCGTSCTRCTRRWPRRGGAAQSKEAALRRQAERVRELEGALEALRQRLVQQQVTQAARSGADRASAAHARAAAQALEDRCQRAQGLSERGRRELEAALAAAERDVAALRPRCQKLEDLVARLQATDAVAAGRALKARLDAEAARLRSSEEERARLEAALAQAGRREAGLEQELGAAQEALERSQQAAREQGAALHDLGNELEETKRAMEDAGTHALELQECNEVARQRLEEAQARLAEAQGRIQALEAEVAGMSAELEKAEAAFQTLQSDSCHKDAEQARMRAALESTARDLEAAQRQCQSLKRERADRLDEAEALRSALAERDHGLRERVDALESSAQHAQQDWEQKEALLASRLRALDTQLSASADERDRLQERLERLTEAHTKDIERLENKHAGAIKKLQEESGKATAVAEMVGDWSGGNKDTF